MPIPVPGGGVGASTLSTLRNQVRSQADVDVTDASDAEIDSALNYAYQEAVGDEEWPFLVARGTFDTVSNQAEYQLLNLADAVAPDIEGHRVLHVATEGQKLEYMHPTRYFDLQPYGRDTPVQATFPSHWTVLDGGTLALYPQPTSEVSVQVVYKAVPPDLTLDDDVPVFPSRYHQILKLGALVRVYQKIADFESAAELQREFDTRLAGMRRDLLQGQPQSLFAWGEGDVIEDPFFGRLRFPFE